MSDLPKDYDVIIVGTGLTESMLAAALARIGKTVLHLDRNQFYGGEFSSHTLDSLIDWSNKITLDKTPEISTNLCNNHLKKYFPEIEYTWNTSIDPKYQNSFILL